MQSQIIDAEWEELEVIAPLNKTPKKARYNWKVDMVIISLMIPFSWIIAKILFFILWRL